MNKEVSLRNVKLFVKRNKDNKENKILGRQTDKVSCGTDVPDYKKLSEKKK